MSRAGRSDSGREKRPFTERWWWFFAVTLWAWLRMPTLVYDLANGNEVDGYDWVALGVIAVFLPLFLWLRRREERKRLMASSTSE